VTRLLRQFCPALAYGPEAREASAMKSFTKHLRSPLRLLVAAASASATLSGAAQQAAPEEIIVTSSIIAQPRREIGTAVSVSAGGQSTCAVNNSGELFCWGNHENGELGDGTTPAPGAGSITPVRVAGTQDYSSVSVGGTHACARTNGGGARCWATSGDRSGRPSSGRRLDGGSRSP